MESKEQIIRIRNLKKQYRLGQYSAKTLTAELQTRWAKLRGRIDPNLPIEHFSSDYTFMALKGINLDVYKGETLGIIGGNGAGKSTLLKILARITAPTCGTLEYNGRISSMLEVGTGFNAEMTGRENIYLNGAILGMSKKEVDSKINEIIEFSECSRFVDTPVKRYSSGMYVKLAFAVAAHLDSEILIMDEVLAVGDMKFQQKCLEKMRELALQEGRTVLYVSHNMATIRQLCDRCIVLREGNIIFSGNVDSAIGVYLNSQVEKACFYNLENAERYPGQNSAKIMSLEYVDKQINFFEPGEKILMDVIWIAEKDIEEVFIRFDMYYVDNSRVGITIGELGTAFAGKKYRSRIELDCTNFKDGRYFYQVSLRKTNSFFLYDSYDVVHSHIGFEIGRETNTPEWNHNSGHLSLNPVRTIKTNEL